MFYSSLCTETPSLLTHRLLHWQKGRKNGKNGKNGEEQPLSPDPTHLPHYTLLCPHSHNSPLYNTVLGKSPLQTRPVRWSGENSLTFKIHYTIYIINVLMYTVVIYILYHWCLAGVPTFVSTQSTWQCHMRSMTESRGKYDLNKLQQVITRVIDSQVVTTRK